MTHPNTRSRSTLLCLSAALPLIISAQPDLVSRAATYNSSGLVSMSAESVYPDLSVTSNFANPQKNMVRHGSLYYHVFPSADDGGYDIFLRTSADGLTWSAGVQVNDDAPGRQRQDTVPNLAVYDDGGNTMVVVSWMDDREAWMQLRTATSSNGGATFGASVPVSTHTDALSITGNVAVDGAGRLYAAWSRFDGGCIGGAWFSTSDDNGATWSAMTQAFVGQCYSGNAHVMAAGPDSVMVVVSDDQFNHSNVIVRRSVDGGDSFTQASVSIYTITQSITQYTSSTVDPSGRAHIVFTYGETQGTASSINYSTSTDWGLTWTMPVPVSDNPLFPVWGYHSGQVPAIAVAPVSGDIYISWADPHVSAGNFEVYLTRSTDGGLTWDTDEMVDLLTTPPGQYYVSMAVQDLGGGNANVVVTWNDDRFVVGMPENGTQARPLLYPVPSADRITIDLSWAVGKVQYFLLDARGARVREGTVGGELHTMDVSGLEPGMYIMRLSTVDRTMSVPWVKE